MATVLPPSRAPPIPTAAPLPTVTSALPPRATTPRPARSQRQTSNVSLPTGSAATESRSSEGMSGGAIAGLVVGALVVLICSVVGGFLLLKKRRRRLMATGKRSQYYDDYTAASARTQRREQDSRGYGGGEKKDRTGGVSDMWSGLRAKAQKVADSITKPATGGAAAASTAAAPGGAIALQPPPPQPQQPYQHARAMSPAFISGAERAASPAPTHMNGVLPPTEPLYLPQESYMTPQQQPALQVGYANSVYSQGSAATGPYAVGQTAPQQQYQQPYVAYQQPNPLLPTPTPTITTPASQPYYYQPGTGLVSVPLTLSAPHQQPLVQPQQQYQQHQHQQQLYQQSYQPVPQPAQAVNNIVYPAPALAPLAPPSQLYHQPPPSLQQVPVSFPQPPPALDSSIPISVASPTSTTPDAGSIFLPGDATRPLLGQGLFKIVPDAEDEEEAKRALKVAGSGVVNDSSVVPPLDLHLGGDFLSSVIQYQNQDQRFQALEASNGTSTIPVIMDNTATESSTVTPPKLETAADVVAARLAGHSNAPPASEAPANGEFQEYRREGGYHDRLAGQKDRPKNQPRYLLDKEEVMNDKQELQESQADGSRVQSSQQGQQPSEVVIVGSDIVFEPLPSAKAAAKAAQRASTAGLDAETSGENSVHNQSSATSIVSATPASSAVGLAEKSEQQVASEPLSPTSLQRGTTIGMALPTIGTEEYLERTDDKEEYSFGLHGDRRALAGSSGDSAVVMHPPTVTALANEAQGDIVHRKAQEQPLAGSSTSVEASTPSLVPPPIARSTKPKMIK
ncbi:hypothetical protein BGZ72_008975 [Mortierella alpina]|nr:hypothetical protein BGZ72_008975 [Mortierella alpina]